MTSAAVEVFGSAVLYAAVFCFVFLAAVWWEHRGCRQVTGPTREDMAQRERSVVS